MLDSSQIDRRLREEKLDELLHENRNYWSRFNLVTAYKHRLRRDPDADFNQFLGELGLPGSERGAETAGHSVLLWHATHARHIDNILEHGFFHHEGVFFAPATFGLPFGLAAAIGHGEEKTPEALVVFACVFDLEECEEGRDYEPRSHEYRFTRRIGPNVVVAALTYRAVELIGETVRPRDGVSPVEFVQKDRAWTILSRNPYHLRGGAFFSTPAEWLDAYLDLLFEQHGELTLLEIINGAYMNIAPLEALPLEEILAIIQRRCAFGRRAGNKYVCLRPVDW